jgi:hypothetical protein
MRSVEHRGFLAAIWRVRTLLLSAAAVAAFVSAAVLLGAPSTDAAPRTRIVAREAEDLRCDCAPAPAAWPNGFPRATAVIVEPRVSPGLSFAVRHMDCALPPEWVLVLVTSHAARGFVFEEFGELMTAGRLHVWELAHDSQDLERVCSRAGVPSADAGCIVAKTAPERPPTHRERPWIVGAVGLANQILTSTALMLAIPTDSFLNFQTDGLLCVPLTPARADMLFEYDYVGAPWDWRGGKVGNGGFSIRSKAAIARAAAATRAEQWFDKPLDAYGNEDMWLADTLVNLRGARVAPHDVARAFSVETLPHPQPLGFHKPWGHLGEADLRALVASCPVVLESLAWNGSGTPRICTARQSASTGG